uniref:SGNH hydrolase-type esterase domain-containing protein n=1 Tax=Kalanchoe fedtschenkoi TaxID=63787 RepID=A0A7N0UNB5_KALFE
MVGPERPQIVLFGSSIVQFCFSEQGWGSILANLYSRRADIVLRGYAGWTSRLALQALTHIFPKDAAVQPSLVVVYFGGNDSVQENPSDVGARVPLPEFIDNMKKIGLHLKSLSERTRVIFLSPPSINEVQINEHFGIVFSGRTNENCRIYSEACLNLCKEIDVKCVDLWTALQRKDDWLTTCFIDGVHLSAVGSKIVAQEILKVLKEADWEPCLYWKSLPIEYVEYDLPASGGAKAADWNISEDW